MKKSQWVVLVCMLGMFVLIFEGCGVENVDVGERFVVKRVLFEPKGQLEFRSPGIQFYNPITKDPDGTYSIQSQTYEMTGEGTGSERRVDERLTVKGRQGRKTFISAYFRYHLDVEKLEDLHRSCGTDFEYKLIHPYIQKIAKNEATRFDAFEIYAGDTRNALQERIIDILTNGEWQTESHWDEETGNMRVKYTSERLTPQLTSRGIVFEDFGITMVDLEAEYEKLVVQKQDAKEREDISKKVTAQLQQEAKQSEAKSEGEKLSRIKLAEASKQETVLAAEAEKESMIARADGEKQAMVLQAEGILAKGKAEAEAIRLKNEAYKSQGGQVYAAVEIAKAYSAGTKREVYVVPAGMEVTLFGETFMDAVKGLTGGMGNLKPVQQ